MKPQRVQLSRAKGWRKPENTIVVSRPTRWGNPFTIKSALDAGYQPADPREFVVRAFREWLSPSTPDRWWQGPESDKRRTEILEGIPSLRGKNLACWCKAGAPCHADVLLELANA